MVALPPMLRWATAREPDRRGPSYGSASWSGAASRAYGDLAEMGEWAQTTPSLVAQRRSGTWDEGEHQSSKRCGSPSRRVQRGAAYLDEDSIRLQVKRTIDVVRRRQGGGQGVQKSEAISTTKRATAQFAPAAFFRSGFDRACWGPHLRDIHRRQTPSDCQPQIF